MTNRVCQVCGKHFYARFCRIRYGEAKFCSQKCYGISNGIRQRGVNNPSWKGKTKMECRICKKVYHVYPSEAKKIQTCSKKCRCKLSSLVQRGNNNSCWRGGTAPVYKLIRATAKYHNWRKEIFVRDNFTCQKCNQFGGKLEAHHKKSFSKLLQEVKNNLPLFSLFEGVMIYSPLWEISNGVTLCEKCHKKQKEGK